ncbi:MAG: response regulator [Alphaproteobacteria bacterium]|nr:response regulator [Alphaproteobacteria bacterium]MBT4016972.1 response regulator [Alphaproteobacteria bacterium]MBT5162202.1 response regulator [Alphaproteobacteria bacterium]MBT6385361.1 response regulator [Alphaproteobacteria bacterium]
MNNKQQPSGLLVETIASSLSDGVIVFADEKHIRFANQSARHLMSHFVVVKENMKTNSIFSPIISQAVSNLLSSPPGETLEFNDGIWPDGIEFSLPVSMTLIADNSDQQNVVIAIMRKSVPSDFASEFVERKSQLLELVGLMGTIAHKVKNQNDVLHVGLSEIGKCLGWELGHVYRHEGQSDKLTPSGIWYEKTPGRHSDFTTATNSMDFLRGVGLPGRVLQTGKPAWIKDIRLDDSFLRNQNIADRNLAAAIAIPVLAFDQVVAVMEFFSEHVEEEDLRLQELLTQVCAQIGHAHERNSAVKSAYREQRRFDVFLEATSDWFWTMGPDLRFTDWKFSDRPSGEMPPAGNTRWEMAAPEEQENEEKWRLHRADLEARKPFRNFEYVFVNMEGEKLWLSSTGIPLFGDDGTFEGYWGATSNITQHKLLESQFLQARKMDAVGKLTGGVAHDFNNLLSVVIWNLDMALEELELDEMSREVIERAQNSAERGVALTNRLLAFSRKQILHPAIVDASDTISEFTGLLDRTLGENVTINTYLVQDVWPVEVDKSELENSILNLAINARDAFDGSGEITISTRNIVLEQDSIANISVTEPGDFVQLSVRDNGRGMTEEVALQACEPFFTTKVSGLGTGLGLSTIYGFAKQSKGYIDITSVVDEGTTVDLYLPRYVGDKVETEVEHESDEIPRGNGEKILVVEDNDEVRFSVTAILGGLGYIIDSVASGRAGLDQLESGEKYDALLTDVILGGDMSGRDLSRIVEKRFPDVAVLHMSGYAESHVVHNGVVEDGVVLLHKPFTKVQLAQHMKALFVDPET